MHKEKIMYLKYVQIINYKNLKNIRFEFSKGANTIIGENDSGKSNALTAIRILLDDNYYYNTKRLKETDFSYSLGDWKGHWIIISAFFDEISNEDKYNEFCAEITPEQENIDFLKSYIRCTDKDFGTVSLFIRPCRTKRIELAEAAQNGTFESVRSQIKLSDYEFYYTARSQADFTNENIYKSNVMKKVDEQTSLVMKPTNGLDRFGTDVLECKGISFAKILSRYLDAKRSVLLFSKGVILVEGDGEEILIPALTKKVLGVSLDEMGIGLINIGSVGFENVACIFDESRLQRKCSIVTDLDVVVEGAKNSNQTAMDRGASRRKKLSQLFGENPYVSAFYAPHTLEVDFVSEESNKDFVCSVIRNTYKDATVIERHVSTIKSGTEAERYDSVMTVANNIKKGWYATLLAETIDARAVIPMYILDAIVFAAKDILSEKLLWKMVQYSFEQYLPDSDFDDLKAAFKEAKSSKEIQTTIKEFCAEFPEDMVSLFIAKAGGLNV